MTTPHQDDPHDKLAQATTCAGRALGRLEAAIESRQAYIQVSDGDCPDELTARVLDAALRARNAIAGLDRELAAILD